VPRGNSIPSDHYLQTFVDLQHLALTTNYRHLSKTTWNKAITPYFNDLNLDDEDDLLDRKKLFNAYKTTFNSLKPLALRQGFQDGWTYTI
jgi:hypothetical protein